MFFRTLMSVSLLQNSMANTITVNGPLSVLAGEKIIISVTVTDNIVICGGSYFSGIAIGR